MTPPGEDGPQASRPLVVPRRAVPYAFLQRTALQRWNLRRYRISRLPPLRYETSLVFLESRVRRARAMSAFGDSIAADFAEIRPHLPERVTSLLDIGCGIAGIDVLLHRHYAQPDLRIHLLDRSQTNRSAFEYGMGAADRFYNSLDAARDLLVANGVAAGQVTLWEAAPDLAFPTETFDLVVSLLSWGHHYPIDTYLAPVLAALRPGGRVIVDVRKNQGGEEALRDALADVRVIATTDKHSRVVARR